MIHASVPPPSPSLPRFGIQTWTELSERLTWRTALLLLLVLLLPGGMLLLPFALASTRKPMARESLAHAAGPTETPLPG